MYDTLLQMGSGLDIDKIWGFMQDMDDTLSSTFMHKSQSLTLTRQELMI